LPASASAYAEHEGPVLAARAPGARARRELLVRLDALAERLDVLAQGEEFRVRARGPLRAQLTHEPPCKQMQGEVLAILCAAQASYRWARSILRQVGHYAG